MRRGRTHVASGDDGPSCGHVHEPLTGRSTICMPMMARGEAIGVLVLEQEGAANPDDMLLVRVCEDLALAIASLRLRASLRSMSVRDPLTGFFNRRYLDETMEREIRRAERTNQPMSVIIADVDRFKNLNDNFGHEAGDEVLQAFGAALLRCARTEDVVCRYGGEEFVILLPNTSSEAAKARAELIREKVRALDLRHKGRPLGILTASFGVASMPDNGATSAAIVRTADAALYQAKAAGRDRVEVAPPRKQSGYDMRAVTVAS
jgi:diguanylate cyclase (GGDEF)-like protein